MSVKSITRFTKSAQPLFREYTRGLSVKFPRMADNKVHDAVPRTQAGVSKPANTNASDKPVFDKDGAVGKQFKADGNIGGLADQIGGPLAKDGAIGKNFNEDGAVGGTVQQNLGKK